MVKFREEKKEYFNKISELKPLVDGLHHKIEMIFKKKQITKEVYHGGKFNGVNCIKIIEDAEDIMKKIADLLIRKKDPNDLQLECDGNIRERCKSYALLLKSLGAIWSQVRGIEKGLLPTTENKVELSNAIAKGKQIWLDLGITTNQPKWHLTFDGHLEEQYDRLGCIADKAEDAIEFEHQTWSKLDFKYRHVMNFEKR